MTEKITITLPDGTEKKYETGVTGKEIAESIGPVLAKDAISIKVNNELKDLTSPIKEDSKIEIITFEDEEGKNIFWHSTAHLLAHAVKKIWPEVKVTIGPAIEEGFYYDFDKEEPFTEEDLEKIEDKMEELAQKDLKIKREENTIEEVKEKYSNNEYKVELIEELEQEGQKTASYYKQGSFDDLCQGPHVESTGELKHFKLTKTSSAYWKGDENRETLQRIYGISYPKKEQLEEHLHKLEEAKKRDHKKIGKEMNLFSITETTGPGLPLFHPNGETILNELRNYINQRNKENNYEYVETPHLFKTDLWEKSGHYENYKDGMFLLDVEDDEYALKPMNCPGHATIFNQNKWSYRDLPVRYAENGKVYRKEQRGELSGLSRVWGFTVDDAHIFARPDQLKEEIEKILDEILNILETLELFDKDSDKVSLGTQPDKYIGDDEMWDKAEKTLKESLENKNINYEIEEGDGAFYGPKIDFPFIDALERDWDGSTVQIDFNMPERFDLTYTTEDNEEKQPVMIHRALYGSYERLLMVLIEHFGGNFPTWLAPEQIRILPISDDQVSYAEEIKNELSDYRVEIETHSWTLGKKIRTTHDDRVPYMIIIGDNEEENNTISVRDRKENEENNIKLQEFKEHLRKEVQNKEKETNFLE